MRDALIVLKFGGSVLKSPATLSAAVQEIYRFRRDGRRVVAVVSAFAGDTDARLLRCRALGDALSPHVVAAHVALGEHEAASLLVVLLDAAGVPAALLSPADAGLGAHGTALDAEPVVLPAPRLHEALARGDVVVVPGFAGVLADGRTALLGRGGSDLTALFLADRLGARCRLVKDVDGLYDRDPNGSEPARRFATAHFADALATDGSIVQHKAVAFARERQLAFELGTAGCAAPTRIGPWPATFTPQRAVQRPLRIAVLGLGTVGGGVVAALRRNPVCWQIVAVATRSPASPRAAECRDLPWTTAVAAAGASGADVVVECTGDVATARACIATALRNGADVVTANKSVLAQHGRELRALAEQLGRRIAASAAVGGSAPILEAIARGQRDGRSLVRLRGVLNGTANHVLEDLRRGSTVPAALERARARGLAEADATRDLDGHDAADKLAVLAHAAGCAIEHVTLDASLADAPAEYCSDTTASDDGRWRQVAELDLRGATPRARVAIEKVLPGDPLHDLPDEWNAACIDWRNGAQQCVRGRGAGRLPSALAVLADLDDLRRRHLRRAPPADAAVPAIKDQHA